MAKPLRFIRRLPKLAWVVALPLPHSYLGCHLGIESIFSTPLHFARVCCRAGLSLSNLSRIKWYQSTTWLCLEHFSFPFQAPKSHFQPNTKNPLNFRREPSYKAPELLKTATAYPFPCPDQKEVGLPTHEFLWV